MYSDWVPIVNVHVNSTKDSRKKMNICTCFHDAALNARKDEPGILDLYNFYHPIHTTFHALYVSWNSAEGTYHASTLAIVLLWKELKKSMKKWNIKIQNIYPDDTPRYEELFPNGRSVYSRLKYDEKITVLAAFIQTIGDDSNEDMMNIKTLASELLIRIEAARSLQAGKKSEKDDLARRVEMARVNCAQAMYSTQGGLMRIYYQNPKLIEAFYDIETLRTPRTKENKPKGGLVLTLAPGQTIEAGIPLTDDKKLLFRNLGEVPLALFAGGDKPEVPENPVILPAGEEAEKLVTELGAPGSRYLYILNSNPDLDGAVEIIEVTGE
jgi:hypothetical protein